MADIVNHYMQCERCGYRRSRKKPNPDYGMRPVYYEDGKPVYLDECLGCQTERADRWRSMAKDKKQ